MENEKRINYDWILIFTILGAAIFYLPFISKNFMTDDWLWLSNARKALSNPAIFFQRPMYGYLRPFNMIVVAILYKIVGLDSYILGLGNILLHAISIFLLSEVLKRFNVEERMRYLSCFIFAFYFLNAPTVAWISSGSDLWVTCLSLLFVIQLLKLFHKPSIEAFALAWALAFSAVMFKESGFVTLGMYFIMAILLKRSPFSGKFRLYTAIFVTTFLAYLIFYALTRTYADKQLDLGAGAIVNLWYFTAYMFIPTAKRIVDILPSSAALILRMAKIFMVFSIPILTFYIIKRGSLAVRFFLAWVVLQISTIAIMKWDGGLFSIYPSDSAARYFQTADIGCAVILAWIITSLYRRLSQTIFSRKFSLVFLAAVFILVNFGLSNLAIKKYSERQADSAILIHGLRPISNALSNGDTLIILTNKKNIPPMSIVESDMLLEAMIFMEFDKSLKVNVNEKPGYSTSDLSIIGRKKILGWDAAGRCLIFPSEN